MFNKSYKYKRLTSGGWGGGLLCPIFKIEKKCPDFIKNALTVSIFELNISIKMAFKGYLGEKTSIFFPVEHFSLVFLTKCL